MSGRVAIIGSGMAGLMVGAMLRQDGMIFEAAPNLPNNHHALLRFRSDEIAQHLNIPFQKVKVLKIAMPWRNKVADAISYSLKSTGRASIRSIVTAEGKIDERYVAPIDFIQQMASAQVHLINFDWPVGIEEIKARHAEGRPTISTIPMPALMEILGYEDRPEFVYRHGFVVEAELSLDSDACATIYYPSPSDDHVRATLTGKRLQIEMGIGFDPEGKDAYAIASEIADDFGFRFSNLTASLKEQKYAKIAPIDERARRKFIMWATDNYGVYSLGRFAVWKAGLLLDDVFHDAQKVLAMINQGHNYSGRLSATTKEI